MKRIPPAFLTILIFLAILAACGVGDNDIPPVFDNDKVSPDIGDAPTDEVTTTLDYKTQALDLSGKDISFLNCESVWGIIFDLDFDNMTGEVLEDAIYTRNRLIEERYNCNIKVNVLACNGAFDKLTTSARQSILAGDNEYSAVYMKAVSDLGMIGDGSLVNLSNVSTLQLDEVWWDKNLINDLTLLGHRFYVTGDLHISPLDCGRCLLFNKDILTDLKLDEPYDLVSDGKWTMDEMMKYCSAAARLNGADSYNWDMNNSTVYGLAAHTHTIWGMMYAVGIRYTSFDEEGVPIWSLDSEINIEKLQKIAEFVGKEGAYFKASNSETDAAAGSYMWCFMNNRSLLISSQVKTATQMRDMEADFGMLPLPKYDESQSEYYTYLTSNNLTLSIPSTNPDPEETGVIIDALTYESSQSVIPVYYDLRVSQKGLRDERSIEMLALIRSGRGINTSDFYGWSTKLADTLYNKLSSGSGSVASDIAAAADSFKASIEQTLSSLK